MAIITISRGSYSEGKEVAERVAEKLGYKCIAREVILKASEEFNIPEIKFARAIHDAPSFFANFTYGREKYIAYFKSALLKQMKADNIVYHGLAGHFFIKGISHALKVRIIADLEDRARVKMQREGISKEKAISAIKNGDEERKKWSLQLYGIDTSDPSLYDLMIHIKKLTLDDAVDLISQCARTKTFETRPESRAAMNDLVVAAAVKAALVAFRPDIEVHARDGKVILGTRVTLIKDPEVVREVETIARGIPGVETVDFKMSHLVEWGD